MRPLFFLSATERAEQVRLKKLSPVELLDTQLSRTEALGPKLNAFVQVDTERARRQGQGAEAAVMRGEAAAIASGCSAGGVGSDGGGSIRVPAHFSGICGLNPTPGRIPSTGHFPNSVGPFALLGVVGPMARTIADLQVLFEVMAGPDDGDPCAAPVPLRRIALEDL